MSNFLDAPPSRDDAGASWATDHRLAVLGALAGVAVVALVAGLALRGGPGGGDDDRAADRGGNVGAAVGRAFGDAQAVPGNRSPAVSATASTATTTPNAHHADLPPVTIPEHSSPPTTIPGSKPSSVPGANGDDPLFGHLVVDLAPGGYKDFPVYLRKDQAIQVLSLADDGIDTDIEVFGPDGKSEGGWHGGKPGVVNGLAWSPRDPLPATGTYVIRVVHVGGSDKPFVIGFFGTT